MNQDVFDNIFKCLDIHRILEREDMALLENLPDAELRSLKAGEYLWREGEAASALLFLHAGWACSTHYHKDGSRQLLEIFLPGDVLGLCRVAMGNRRTNAVMLTDGRVCELPYSSLVTLFNYSPDMAALLFAIANQRQAMLAERQIVMTHQSAKQKLAHFICECHTRLLEIGVPGQDEFLLPLTQQDLADTLGMSAVHISRTFSQLAEEELVLRHSFQLIILDAVRLRKVAAFDERYLRIMWTERALFVPGQETPLPIGPTRLSEA
ncbi:Crp/Fnr family transcriptional regulator [Halomonas sp. GXIMD04776]|uniref:Crp/Fnr family transcriptional regulator n=1 Tax=Halomonas sp. GXIMD04776 TaxID=3415605 RepID=UPI003CC42C25